LRRLILLLAVLAAMMLVASPVLAWQAGPGQGNKFSKNYYPTSYYKYCDENGSQFLGSSRSNSWCDQWYTTYKTKTFNGDKWYYVHVYYKWKSTQSGRWQTWDDWYYCQYHRYDDQNSNHWYFKAWVTFKPTGDHNWESFYWQHS
jgi:hypothetical protein